MNKFHRFWQLTLKVSLLNLLLQSPSQAWDFSGHFLIGQIAQRQLHPSAVQEIDNLLAELAWAEPRIHDFVEAGVWLDTQNWHGFGAFTAWHYEPLPSPEQTSAPALFQHAVWATEQAMATLQNPHATRFQKALMLRVLLHTVGELHQPLHTLNHSHPAYPDGDQGGTRFALSNSPYPSLHALWDAAGGQYPYLKLGQQAEVLPLLQAAERQTPALTVPPPQKTPREWAHESHTLALSSAYVGIQPADTPSAAYLDTVQRISREQIWKAGHRLGQVLNQLFPQDAS
ncbi:MAG: S1/P1 nuclease [Candidatus Sericytochromatia bacterium]